MSNLNYGARQALAEKTRLGRKATTRTCTTCHQPTLTGLDDDACAFTATVNPYPINAREELEAVKNGKQTYTFTKATQRIDSRPPPNIISHPATEFIVLIEHECWKHPPGDSSRDVTIPSTQSINYDGPPPF